MRKAIVILTVLVLPAAGGFLGRFSAGALARTHYVVRLADRVRLEKADDTLERTLESEAFRRTGNRPDVQLFAEAAAIEKKFVLGSVLLGVWCGGVFAFAVFGLNRTRRREIYEIHYDACVSCGRCFSWCPRERLRLDALAGKREDAPLKRPQ